MIDLSDFEEEHAEALAKVNAFCANAERGLHPDRWCSTSDMFLMYRGIRAQQQIMRWQAETLRALLQDGRE